MSSDLIAAVWMLAALALCAYACVPKAQFPEPKKRIRAGFAFFTVFVAATTTFAWDKVTKLFD
ncbi:hypothetical protein [Tardiphaga sp. 862_B3_N1_1]|uniref:hypothetical protein n=1 Tax=Tardiphaga sp. 862_B3_N1_1 TaxID=3240763 RepID=UPI003F8AD219